jgi:hypothetical protein
MELLSCCFIQLPINPLSEPNIVNTLFSESINLYSSFHVKYKFHICIYKHFNEYCSLSEELLSSKGFYEGLVSNESFSTFRLISVFIGNLNPSYFRTHSCH